MPCCCALCRTRSRAARQHYRNVSQRRVRGDAPADADAGGGGICRWSLVQHDWCRGSRAASRHTSVRGALLRSRRLPRWGEASIGEDTAGRDPVVILSHALWQHVSAATRPSSAVRSSSKASAADYRRHAGGFPIPIVEVAVLGSADHDSRDIVNSWAGDYMPVMDASVSARRSTGTRRDLAVQSRVLRLFPWQMPPAGMRT